MTTRIRPHLFTLTIPLFLLALFAATQAAASPVAIQVENQKGKAIDGAEVTVRSQEGETPLVTATTSDHGVAVINELGPGEWYFEITRPGYMMFSAYVRLRDGKKPELGFASQVSRGDDWEPMRVKFTKASIKLARDAVNAPTPEPRVRQPVRVDADESPTVITRVEPTTAVGSSEPDAVARQRAAEDLPAGTAQPEVHRPPEPVDVASGTNSGVDNGLIEDTFVAEGDADDDIMGMPVVDMPNESEAKPEQRPVENPLPTPDQQVSAETVAVPSVVEDVEPERSAGEESTAPSLTVADGDPLPRSATESSDDSEAAYPKQADSDNLDPEDAVADIDIVEDAAQTPTLDPAAPEDAVGQPTPETDLLPEPELSEQALPEPFPALEEEAIVADLPDPTIEESQTPSTPTVAADSAPLDFLTTPPRYLRSATAGNCPECAEGEWAVSATVEAGTAGDTRSTSTCAEDLSDKAQQFAQQLADRSQGAFVGPMMAALWRTASDSARSELVAVGSELMSPGGYCQVVGTLLPKGATMTGYSLEAWDDLGGRSCSAEGICALPKAGWSGSPTVISGENATVIYSVFRNRSTRHLRNAELTVLFTPPADWQ